MHLHHSFFSAAVARSVVAGSFVAGSVVAGSAVAGSAIAGSISPLFSLFSAFFPPSGSHKPESTHRAMW
uniref:Uncharacterized protein n=1 Tax=Panstrongylus lignarius TaxID=156445 RepID=A0A224Y198_9HEMI